MRFFKKIQDWILKSERIRKWSLSFFTKQINPRSFGSWCIKGTEESTSRVDSSVPLTHHYPRCLGLICLVKKLKIRCQILSGLRIQSWIFLKKRTLSKYMLKKYIFGGKNERKTDEISLLDDYYYQTTSSVANQNAGFALVHQLGDTNY